MKQKHTPKMTAVFECSLLAFNGNPFKVATPFGSPVALCVGDMVNDPLRDAKIIKAAEELASGVMSWGHNEIGTDKLIGFVEAYRAAVAEGRE